MGPATVAQCPVKERAPFRKSLACIPPHGSGAAQTFIRNPGSNFDPNATQRGDCYCLKIRFSRNLFILLVCRGMRQLSARRTGPVEEVQSKLVGLGAVLFASQAVNILRQGRIGGLGAGFEAPQPLSLPGQLFEVA